MTNTFIYSSTIQAFQDSTWMIVKVLHIEKLSPHCLFKALLVRWCISLYLGQYCLHLNFRVHYYFLRTEIFEVFWAVQLCRYLFLRKEDFILWNLKMSRLWVIFKSEYLFSFHLHFLFFTKRYIVLFAN